MKKGGQRVAIIGATFYSIEVIRVSLFFEDKD
jgi:hypothetical protein